MKDSIIISLCILMVLGCSERIISKKETVIEYYNARSSVEFNKVKDLIHDSLTVIEGDYIMPYSKESYYEVFKWDSIFQTTYDLVELEENDGEIIASISLSSIRNKFLKNDHMTCQFKVSFEGFRISKIESLECSNVNWDIWQKRVNLLVNWIDVNHPEHNGFINDMTMNGAKNYLKAIELYESNANEQ